MFEINAIYERINPSIYSFAILDLVSLLDLTPKINLFTHFPFRVKNSSIVSYMFLQFLAIHHSSPSTNNYFYYGSLAGFGFAGS